MLFNLKKVDVVKNEITIGCKFYTEVIDFKNNDIMKVINKYKNTRWFSENSQASLLSAYNDAMELIYKDAEDDIDSDIFIGLMSLNKNLQIKINRGTL